ncbi:fumarylacetoacetate hydrolase family protein [Bradyrhizobium jicamae]|uniref:fumarylacetoacetate hydrolase family protein n=1 Tax=Bradyrhizobium jicamae TaxID=280332 RepID=UPI001BAD19BD|nr:fumarylacetoacetate hydrolase family protein [Bradyrhizobium jicamae]MBR0755322.1 fumarylacetoacetate hydrolase family protein [Bradyrhizobium jicamae]
MKLVRYGLIGRERPGIIDAAANIRDLSSVVDDIDGQMIANGGIDKIRSASVEALEIVKGNPRLGACVGNVRNMIAVGLNYSDHAKESGMPIPSEPIIFLKHTGCICGPNDNTILPQSSTKLDHEVELGIVIAKPASNIPSEEDAKEFIAGYFVHNDVSERSFQIDRSGGQWSKGKSCVTFGPIGPWFVTADEVEDPQNLDMWLDVNEERRQRGNTKTMIFSAKYLVWYCSQFMAMQPGDVIVTGTPPGVGLGAKPTPKFLKAGDVVTLGIEGLGEQRQVIVQFGTSS